MPTLTQEDYLRAIYRLSETLARPIKSSELTTKLGLSKSTVSQRLKEMQKHGWIQQMAYGPINLTTEGLRLAQNLTYKHRLIELYLMQELGVPKDQVHQEAHQLEHAVSDDLIQRIAQKMGHPTCCPHGKKIPPLKTNSD